MDHKQVLIALLKVNTATTVGELEKQFQQGLVTETELLRGLFDMATRFNVAAVDILADYDEAAFPYTVAAGTYDDDGENCKYSDTFATLRDAIVAWEEVDSSPWARIEFRVGEFVYGLDPLKIRRAKKVTLDNGEKRTLYYPCDVAGRFYD